ncbi:uncharacterized protein LOC119573769 [Penaeus monodon]|uniref:uncharacterized protein LOC119573769 n=1 Tax=Penaeus monodon TaxID=6687 RepID=UPI0018A6DF64|nr:uncharacterized protein LOC119573769 [Penaeus monodon]XP_037776802.1 uncharacterized protein LOC119573769 [Penaeus monodon]
MKVAVLLCFTASLAVTAALPADAPAAPMVPSPAMIEAFIPTPEEIQALNALHTTPAPGVVPTPGAAPVGPPTMPPAVGSLIAKYKAAVAAFIPSTAAPV